jgi:hypothetical protein
MTKMVSKPTCKDDDSGVIDLGALLGEARRSATTRRSDPLDVVSPLGAPPPVAWMQLMAPPAEEHVVSPPLAHDSVPALASSVAPPSTSRAGEVRRRLPGFVLGAAVMLVAVAGAAALVTRSRDVASTSPPAPAVVARAAPLAEAPAPAAPALAPRVESPASLAKTPERRASPSRHARHAIAPASTTPAPAASETAEPPVTAPPSAPEASEDAPAVASAPPASDAPTEAPAVEPSASPPATDLGVAMRAAVGEAGEAPKAEVAAGAPRQLRPSAGALTSAIRSVMPEARACLAGDPRVRAGRVIFGSDGAVASVELMGSSPVDDCVRAALAKARIDPFSEAPFAMSVAVRP